MKARSNDGAEIFYELYDFTDPWASSEAVILMHGGRGNHKRARPAFCLQCHVEQLSDQNEIRSEGSFG